MSEVLTSITIENSVLEFNSVWFGTDSRDFGAISVSRLWKP